MGVGNVLPLYLKGVDGRLLRLLRGPHPIRRPVPPSGVPLVLSTWVFRSTLWGSDYTTPLSIDLWWHQLHPTCTVSWASERSSFYDLLDAKCGMSSRASEAPHASYIVLCPWIPSFSLRAATEAATSEDTTPMLGAVYSLPHFGCILCERRRLYGPTLRHI